MTPLGERISGMVKMLDQERESPGSSPPSPRRVAGEGWVSPSLSQPSLPASAAIVGAMGGDGSAPSAEGNAEQLLSP